jgi:hypothetical protein
MRGIGITACTLVVVVGGVAIAAEGDERGASSPPERGQPLMAGFAASGPTAGSKPPRAVVRGCEDRIGAGGPWQGRGGDTIIGPLRFNMQGYSPMRAWRQMVRAGQWLKSVARLRAGGQVTLVVPPEQRSWMRLAYAHHHRRGGVAAVTLRACRHRRSLEARRKECVWADGASERDYASCRTGPTRFSGGFEIDYAEAPEQGRCAELIVWVKGEQEPHRVRLLRVEPGECSSETA